MLRKLRKKIIIQLVRFYWGMSCFFSYRAAQYLGAVLGTLAYYVLAKYRKRVLRNLKERLQAQESEIKPLARRVFQTQGMNFTEFFYLQKIRKEDFHQYYKINNLENLQHAYAKQKGVILVTAHFGNWEAIIPVIRQSGFVLNVIARKYYIPELNEILTRLRTDMGIRIIQRGEAGAARKILKALKSGEIIGMLIDQNIKSTPNIDVDFFGEKAPTSIGMATLALRSGCSIVPCFTRRNEKGVHVVECLPELSTIQTNDHQKDLFLNTQKISNIIETVVRNHPDQWVWFHRRWHYDLPT